MSGAGCGETLYFILGFRNLMVCEPWQNKKSCLPAAFFIIHVSV
jgi:hypothetical protein